MGAASLVALAVAGAVPARAQGFFDQSSAVLPNGAGGTTVRVDNLRRRFLPANQLVPDDRAPAYQFGADLDVSEEYTDNALGAGQYNPTFGAISTARRTSDFITVIRPGFSVSANTARIVGSFNYAPSIYVYAQNGSQDSIAQNFSGQVTATLVPDALFLDLRAFGAVQTLSGGVGATGTNTTNRANQVQSTSFSASPYFNHQFGGTGTLNAGVSYSRSMQGGVTGLNGQAVAGQQTGQTFDANGNPVPTFAPLVNTQLNNGTLTTIQEHASFTTGEDFGRVSQRVSASATQYEGGGVYQGAHRDLIAYDVGYAVNRLVTVLGRVGHEDIAYGGILPYRISDITWAVGTKLTPNRDSSLTLTYGRHEGADSIAFNGSYAITPRIRLFGSYSEGVETDQEDLQNTLASADVDSGGGLFDSQTGAPIALGSGFYGVQNNVNRVKRLSASAIYFLDRDSFTAALSRQSRTTLAANGTSTAAALALAGTSSDSGTYGTFSWAHDLSPATRTNLFLQYGTYSGLSATQATGTTPARRQSNTQSVASLAASVSYAISETLSTNAQYSFSHNRASTQGGSYDENTILVGVHKRF